MLCEKCLQFENVSFPIGKDMSVQGIYGNGARDSTSDLGICALC